MSRILLPQGGIIGGGGFVQDFIKDDDSFPEEVVFDKPLIFMDKTPGSRSVNLDTMLKYRPPETVLLIQKLLKLRYELHIVISIIGGGGATAIPTGSSVSAISCAGGGGGGCCGIYIYSPTLSVTGSYNIANAPTYTPTNSTFSGYGRSLTANGGGYGSGTSSPTNTSTVNGGAGGTSTGGDFNFTGGAGGTASGRTTAGANTGGGGGCATRFGNGGNGGSAGNSGGTGATGGGGGQTFSGNFNRPSVKGGNGGFPSGRGDLRYSAPGFIITDNAGNGGGQYPLTDPLFSSFLINGRQYPSSEEVAGVGSGRGGKAWIPVVDLKGSTGCIFIEVIGARRPS